MECENQVLGLLSEVHAEIFIGDMMMPWIRITGDHCGRAHDTRLAVIGKIVQAGLQGLPGLSILFS